MDYIGIGNRLRIARKKQHLTQTQLAADAGLSVSFLGHIERGTRKASVETLVALCDRLNLSLDELIGRDYALNNRRDLAREVLKLAMELIGKTH